MGRNGESVIESVSRDDLEGRLPLAAMGAGGIVTWRRPPVMCYLRPPATARP